MHSAQTALKTNKRQVMRSRSIRNDFYLVLIRSLARSFPLSPSFFVCRPYLTLAGSLARWLTLVYPFRFLFFSNEYTYIIYIEHAALTHVLYVCCAVLCCICIVCCVCCVFLSLYSMFSHTGGELFSYRVSLVTGTDSKQFIYKDSTIQTGCSVIG